MPSREEERYRGYSHPSMCTCVGCNEVRLGHSEDRYWTRRSKMLRWKAPWWRRILRFVGDKKS